MERKALYAGSFDPVTNGHLNIIERAAGMFDSLTVAIVVNPNKKCLFTVDERVEIAKEVKKRGAALMNVLPLIPLAKMKHYSRPVCSMMESVREQVEEIIPVFRACTQCRADAYGIPGKKSEDHHLGMTPQSHY